MKIKRATDGGFLATFDSDKGPCITHMAFTAIQANRHMRHYAKLMSHGEHKATVHVTDQPKFWRMVEDAGVPITFVSSSNAKEGNLTGEAA